MFCAPYEIAPDAYVIPSFHLPPGAPGGVFMSSMVLRSAEPVLFDTGLAMDREGWLDAVGSVVDLADVRWIVLSHDDPDHVGNLEVALELCPEATVVSSWFLNERLQATVAVPPARMRWLDPGDSLDVGDRILAFTRPPLYDAPTTRVAFDPVSGVLWGGDLCACPLPEPVLEAGDVPGDALAGGFQAFQRAASPWVELVDRDRYEAEVGKLEVFGIEAIASTHGPVFRGAMVDHAFELLRAVPEGPAPELPGQPVLDEIVAMLEGSAPEHADVA